MASVKSARGCFYFFVLNNGKNYFKNVENSWLNSDKELIYLSTVS